MRKEAQVIAIACADIHLQHAAPRCRLVEPNWYDAMRRPLDEIVRLQKKYMVPVICAGDIFTQWNAPAELINFAIEYLPTFNAIPGQHDLPQHNYQERYRSAYETLVKAGTINIDMDSLGPHYLADDVSLWAFPWGFPVKSPKEFRYKYNIAVVHEYNWIPNYEYPQAPKEMRVTPKRKELTKFDIVILGDNHQGFHTQIGNTEIFNCGTLMRRAIDEADYKPQVGLIYDDMTVKPYYLDISKDKIDRTVNETIDEKVTLEVQDFLDELDGLTQNPFDFREVVERYLDDNNVSEKTNQVLLMAMEMRT